jgi:MoxR-like ATPase
MEEFQVTADGESRDLPRPFFVIATENPIEYEGTYSLPEAQLDRFMSRVSIGYPSHDDEVAVLTRQIIEHPISHVEPVVASDQVVRLQHAVREIHVDESLKDYIVNICQATRPPPDVDLGASPRGSIALLRLAQAVAAIAGRDFIVPDDIKRVANSALAHRVVIRPDRRLQGVTSGDVVSQILDTVTVPIASGGGAG